MQSGENEVTAYAQIMRTSLTFFIRASEAVGGPVVEMANKVKRAFDEQYQFIQSATVMKTAPNDGDFAQMLNPLATIVTEIERFREQNRSLTAYFNHLSTVSESIQALCWVTVKPAPTQFLKDMRESGEYFGNRVLSNHRGDAVHVEWLNKWYQVLKDLEEYVKMFHRTGFSWGAGAARAGNLGSFSAVASPPPPPPPPSPAVISGPGPAGDSRAALLNQLNQGVQITRMLRPVVRRDGTEAQAPSSAQGGAIPRVPGASASAQARPAPPPKFVLDGAKWRVENQKSVRGLTIATENMNESLAMYRCEDTVLEVRNKMNNISIDNCKKTIVSLKGVISSIDLIRCKSVKLQLNDAVPLVNMDNCDCIQLFLTEAARNVQIISSNSTSCNICLLTADGDYEEVPVPEQIRTTVDKTGVHSEVIRVE